MSEAQIGPKVSIVIATYQPGDGLDRLVESLDLLTLEQEEFEVIFVDDGSADDTFLRLKELEGSRANFRAFRIENSGWPSRPRNVGIERARGAYIMFMDHDDTLFADGLRQALKFAADTGADLVSLKESKTNDPWWAMSNLHDGNLANVIGGGGIEKILPMVPHKLYRRQLLLDHNLRFPEGARVLWEDIYINVGAFRHSKVVAVFADSPVYLWHASSSNSSHTFDPARRDFWERLEDVMKYTALTLDTEALADDRATVIAHQVRVRIIDRMVRFVRRANDPGSPSARRAARILLRRYDGAVDLRLELATMRAFFRARRLLRRYGTPEVLSKLPPKHRIQESLLRSGRRDLMVLLHEWDVSAKASVAATSMRWRAGKLELRLQCVWEAREGGAPAMRRLGDRIVLAVPEAVAARVPSGLLDVTDSLRSEFQLEAIVRDRLGNVSWTVPVTEVEPRFVDRPDGGVAIVATASAQLDIATMAGGNCLSNSVWDLHSKPTWCGMARNRGIDYQGPVRTALVDGMPVVAYRNTSGSISLDLAGRLRTFASDAAPASGPAGYVNDFSVRLTNVVSDRDAVVPIEGLRALPDDEIQLVRGGRADNAAVEDRSTPIFANVIVASSDAQLAGGASLDPGRYRLVAQRGGVYHATRHVLLVQDDSRLNWIVEGQ